MYLSIVTTLYRSESYIREFYERITRVAGTITDSYEIIMVNDGSPDNSLGEAVELRGKDRKVRVIDLSRNFGHHKAIMTGLAHARGELIFLIDVDLEEEPELLRQFHEEFVASDADVVYGVQNFRKGAFFERISGSIFYRVFNFLSDWKVTPNVSTLRLMSKRYVINLIRHRDKEIFIDGLLSMTGYTQKPLYFSKKNKDTSSYTLVKKITMCINAITSFSNKPLIYIFYLGVVILLLSGGFIIKMFLDKMFYDIQPGFTSIIVSIWFTGGLTLISLGVVGIYLAKIFMEVKSRPYTIIRAVYEDEENTR